MFEKEAEEYARQSCFTEMPNPSLSESIDISDDIKEAVMFGYNKANEWHKVSDELPEMEVLVYLWDNVDEFPVIGRRHIPSGAEKWVWDCKWGDGYTVSQLAGKDYLWREIITPKEVSK